MAITRTTLLDKLLETSRGLNSNDPFVQSKIKLLTKIIDSLDSLTQEYSELASDNGTSKRKHVKLIDKKGITRFEVTGEDLFIISEVFHAKEIDADSFFKRLPLNSHHYQIINGIDLYYIDDAEAFKIPPKVYLSRDSKFFNNKKYYVSTRDHVLKIDYESEKLIVKASFDIGGHGGRYTEVDYSAIISIRDFEIANVSYLEGKTFNWRA